jgi:hypothetical protein
MFLWRSIAMMNQEQHAAPDARLAPNDSIELATQLVRWAQGTVEAIAQDGGRNLDLERLETEIEALRERVEQLEWEAVRS